MGKIVSILIGLVLVVVGIYGIRLWFPSLACCFKGIAPAIAVLVGFIMLFAGISEMKDEAARKKEEKK
ncbi:MAG: hypothetical protein ABIH01_00670 [Candidatus Omnitrophota bacterium]